VFDHLGIAVRSLEEAIPFYRDVLGLGMVRHEMIPGEKTKVTMMPMGPGQGNIELLEATEPDSPIARFLAKRGPGLHHVCLRVPDLSTAVARMRERGVRLVNQEIKVGAGGRRYVFIHPSSVNGVLLELVEQPSQQR
jgi:methylmalonyl-CoA epimerase